MSETRPLIHEVLSLASTLEAEWPERLAAIPAWHPRNETLPGAPPAAVTPPAPSGAPAPEGGGDPAPEGGGFDYGRIESMLDQRFEQQDQRLGGLEQRLPTPPAPEPQQPPDPFAPLGEMGYDEQEMEQMRGVLSPLFQGVLQQALAPLQQQNQQLAQQLAGLNNELDAGDLVERYPALGTDEVWAPVSAEAVQLAQSLGLQVQRPEEVPARVIEAAYLARLGRERVASETPAGGGNPALESAGGATPPVEEPDLVQGIIDARGPRTAAAKFWGA